MYILRKTRRSIVLFYEHVKQPNNITYGLAHYASVLMQKRPLQQKI